MKVILLIILINVLLLRQNGIQCSKILAVFTTTSTSHFILASALMKELANKGHDVTFVGHFSVKNKPTNGTWTEIILDGVVQKLEESLKDLVSDMAKQNILKDPFTMDTICNSITRAALEHPKMQALLHSNAKFDVVIVEWFLNDALKYIAPHFNAPLISVTSFGQSVYTNYLFGNPEPPSFVGDNIWWFTNRLSLLERVQNTLYWVYHKLFTKLWYLPGQKEIYDQFFPDAKADFYDVIYNASVMLLNSHLSTWEPAPLMPNMIEIGGHHIEPPKTLPKDIGQFFDRAKNGVIYFSLGSIFRSKDLPVETRTAILNVFGKLKQKVLWKFEDENLVGKPDNVKIVQWAPQQDILAHPNVKLFITHGGFGSMQETIHHGVPILAIPLFADQPVNVRRAVSDGIGLKLNIDDLGNESKLEAAINEILNNPKYSKNAKQRSRIMHDRPRSAKDTATFWVEYVIRHQGAPHLRTAAMDLAWYQYIMLDVLAIIGGTIAVTLLSLYYLVRLCCCRRKSSIKDQKKVKKS